MSYSFDNAYIWTKTPEYVTLKNKKKQNNYNTHRIASVH